MRTEFGRFGRQVSGYSLEHLLPEHGRSVDRFLVGSEGTLALVREATVRLVEDTVDRLLVVLGYPSMVEAADAVPALLAATGGAHGGLRGAGRPDRRPGERARGSAVPELPGGAGWLFVELVGPEARELATKVVGRSRCVGAPARHRRRRGGRAVADP